MENKAKMDQIKKIENLDTQLSSTINKIDQVNSPLIIDKKKLWFAFLFTFILAIIFTSITTFLVIDPMHWYTDDYGTYLSYRKAKIIKRLKNYVIPNEVILNKNKRKVQNLIDEIKNKRYLEDVFKTIDENFDPNTEIKIWRDGVDPNGRPIQILNDPEQDLASNTYKVGFDFTDHDLKLALEVSVTVKVINI